MSDTTAPPAGDTYTPPSSQADLDRIVEQRLARERQKYADYDDLREKASKFDELDAATKTELQKAQDAIAERDAKLADLPKQVQRQVLKFASTAASKGFVDPEDALLAIDSGVDLSDDKAVGVALDELAERKPHWVAKPKKLPTRPKPESGNGDQPGNGDIESLEGKERAAAALRQFRNTR